MVMSRYSRFRVGFWVNVDSKGDAWRQRQEDVWEIGGGDKLQLSDKARLREGTESAFHGRLLSTEKNQDIAVNVSVSVTTMVLFFCCMSSCFRWKSDLTNRNPDAEKDEMDPNERKEYVEKHLRSLKVLTGQAASTRMAVPESSSVEDSEATSESGSTASLEAQIPESETTTTRTTSTAKGTSEDDVSDILEEGREDVCAICLINYCDGDDICFSDNSQCEHTFHRECMVEWLQKHWECPICRRPYLSEKKEKTPC